MTCLQTAYLSHKKCFICRRANKKMYQVNRMSIEKALTKFKIFIKPNLRHCGVHLNENGYISEEILQSINTKIIDDKSIFKGQHFIKLLDLVVNINQKSGVFDKFKDLSSMDDEFCFKIARWNKKQFIKFSNYITIIYDTEGRTKEQLIALY